MDNVGDDKAKGEQEELWIDELIQRKKIDVENMPDEEEEKTNNNEEEKFNENANNSSNYFSA